MNKWGNSVHTRLSNLENSKLTSADARDIRKQIKAGKNPLTVQGNPLHVNAGDTLTVTWNNSPVTGNTITQRFSIAPDTWFTAVFTAPNMWVVIDDPVPKGPPPPEQWAVWMAEAKGLIDRGYRRISRRRGTLARVDREDWHQALLAKYPKTERFSEADQIDFYRRYVSEDKVTVSRYVSEMIPVSTGDMTGYVV